MVLPETLADAQQRIADLEAKLVAARKNRLTTNNGANVPIGAANGGNNTANVANMTFCRDNPSLWFTQAEITLRNAGIQSREIKADCIAEKLDLEALQSIEYIITTEPCPRKFLI